MDVWKDAQMDIEVETSSSSDTLSAELLKGISDICCILISVIWPCWSLCGIWF